MFKRRLNVFFAASAQFDADVFAFKLHAHIEGTALKTFNDFIFYALVKDFDKQVRGALNNCGCKVSKHLGFPIGFYFEIVENCRGGASALDCIERFSEYVHAAYELFCIVALDVVELLALELFVDFSLLPSLFVFLWVLLGEVEPRHGADFTA